jgi:hypothetical protein
MGSSIGSSVGGAGVAAGAQAPRTRAKSAKRLRVLKRYDFIANSSSNYGSV